MIRPKLITITILLLGLISCNKNEVKPNRNDTQLISDHTLEYDGSIGVPYASPKGICSDGQNVWLMFGAHNGDEHTLIYYDIETNTILQTYVYYNLIEQLGTGVYGIAYHQNHIWISVSGNTNKIVKVAAQDGQIIQTWASPSFLGPSDMSYSDNRNMFWFSTGTGNVYSIDAITGGSDHFITIFNDNGRDHGVVAYKDEIWMGDMFSRDIYVYDDETADFLGIIPNAIQENGKFCMHEDQLYVLGSSGIRKYKITD